VGGFVMTLVYECNKLEVNLNHFPPIIKEIGEGDSYNRSFVILEKAKIYELPRGICITGTQRFFKMNWLEIDLPDPDVDLRIYDPDALDHGEIKERTKTVGWWKREQVKCKCLQAGWLTLKWMKDITIELRNCAVIFMHDGIQEAL
jgi:hypothetical protein